MGTRSPLPNGVFSTTCEAHRENPAEPGLNGGWIELEVGFRGQGRKRLKSGGFRRGSVSLGEADAGLEEVGGG